MTKQQMAQKVRNRLVGVEPGGVTLEVMDSGIRQIDNWWWVPVRPSHSPERWSAFSRALGELTDELQEKDQLDVLLATGMTAEEEQEAQRYKEGAQATASRLPKMLRPTKATALEIVRKRLKDVRPCGVPLVVQPKGMYKVDNKWWRVPVHPLDWPEDKNFSEIYEALAEVEDDLQTEERLPIVFFTGWPLTEEEKAEAQAA